MPRGTGTPKGWSERLVNMKVKDLLGLVSHKVVLNRYFRDGKEIKQDILYEGGLSKCPEDLLELNVLFISPEGEISLYLHIEVE